jgi:predicted Zn-dependent peptidase
MSELADSQLTVLPGGLRVVSHHMPQVRSVAVGIWASVGARHEPARLNGISHFIEHLLFKGTARRSARKIMAEIEGVGGDINANTGEERTCYYATAPARCLRRVCDVLFDLYLHPRLAPRDIELERGVIAEEIQMYRDEPDQHVQDLLGALLWPGHALGRPITGTLESIARFSREDFLAYRASHYLAGNTLVSAAGALRHDELLEMVTQRLHLLPHGRNPRQQPAPEHPLTPRRSVENRPIQQTHLALGLPGPGSHDPDRHAMALLGTILGGNASSRLFQELRERRGWCYQVGTYLQVLSDCGVLHLSMALDQKNLRRSLAVVRRQLEELRRRPVGRTELERAREYILGSSSISLERTTSQNSRIALGTLIHGRIVAWEEWEARLRAVGPEDLARAAERFLDPSRVCLAAVGPSVCEDDLSLE